MKFEDTDDVINRYRQLHQSCNYCKYIYKDRYGNMTCTVKNEPVEFPRLKAIFCPCFLAKPFHS